MPFEIEKRIEMFDLYYKKLPAHNLERYKVEKLKNFIISNAGCENVLFLKLLLHFCMLDHPLYPPLDFESLGLVSSPEDLFALAIEFYSENGFHKNIIGKVLGYLAVTRCGLSIEELSQVCSHSEAVIRVLEVFHICLFSYDNLWMFKSDIFNKVIINKFFPNPYQLHMDLIETLNTHKVTVRTVHEKIYHYKEIKEWMLLKDTICILEVFFIMYTPQYRLELFRCWSLLQEHHFDPVQEYNKTLEQFVEQHKPKNPEIFIILVQICRFFKEFSQTENTEICEFRHPPLRRLHELKELNIYDEIILLDGVINLKNLNPLRKDESFAVENKKSRSVLKESILANLDDEDEETKKEKPMSLVRALTQSSKKKNEMYYYKRWLWIEFPWCSLDVYSDFSQIMQVFSAEDMNFQHDNEMAISTLRIIRESKMKASRRYVPPKRISIQPSVIENPERSVTAFVRASGILHESLPPLNQTIQLNPISEKPGQRQLSRGATTDNLQKRQKTDYNFDLMFKELTPSNVLLKVGAKVADYSNYEILKKKKENNELQTNYNRFVNEVRIKQLQLESIKSQIAKSEDKMKEGKEIAAKIEEMKKKMERIYEKINKAEVESKRLEQVITCCFKNSAKNELWEKGLEKGIQNIKDMVEVEKLELSQCEEEKNTLDEQINEFEKWFQDKIKIQENTLDRVLEQFSFKASIKEALVSGENKRANLISVQAPPRSENYFNNKLKERQGILKKIQRFKEALENKIQSFEKIIQRLQTVATISGPQDLTSIIWQLERNEELYQSRFKLDDKLKDLKSQKDALEVKLSFLKKKEVKTVYSEVNPEIITQNILENEKKIHNLSEACKKQELAYYACEGIIQHIFNMLGMNDKKLEKSNQRDVLKIVGDKILAMKAQPSRPALSHSMTLKVNTLQVPYSSKFSVEEATTPMGPNALINTPIGLSPMLSPVSSIENSNRTPSNRKSIIRLPR